MLHHKVNVSTFYLAFRFYIFLVIVEATAATSSSIAWSIGGSTGTCTTILTLLLFLDSSFLVIRVFIVGIFNPNADAII